MGTNCNEMVPLLIFGGPDIQQCENVSTSAPCLGLCLTLEVNKELAIKDQFLPHLCSILYRLIMDIVPDIPDLIPHKQKRKRPQGILPLSIAYH